MAYLSLDWLIDHRGIGRATSSVFVERQAVPILHRIGPMPMCIIFLILPMPIGKPFPFRTKPCKYNSLLPYSPLLWP
jgi:hypothetical protein